MRAWMTFNFILDNDMTLAACILRFSKRFDCGKRLKCWIDLQGSLLTGPLRKLPP